MAKEREYTRLTPREVEVLHYAIAGYSASATARELGVGHETIKTHRSNIIQKYGARNMTQAVALHFTEGIPQQELDLPEIILATRLRHLLRILMTKLENELNDELVILLKKATKDLRS